MAASCSLVTREVVHLRLVVTKVASCANTGKSSLLPGSHCSLVCLQRIGREYFPHPAARSRAESRFAFLPSPKSSLPQPKDVQELPKPAFHLVLLWEHRVVIDLIKGCIQIDCALLVGFSSVIFFSSFTAKICPQALLLMHTRQVPP